MITFPIWADDFSAGFGVPFSSLTLTVCDCDDDEHEVDDEVKSEDEWESAR